MTAAMLGTGQIVVLLLFGFVAYLVHRRNGKHDPREPPLVPSIIPFIGPIIGILRHGWAYYGKKSAKYPFPAYTLDLLLIKIYIITSPGLVSVVQRNHRVISAEPFLTNAAERLAGIRGHGLDILRETQAGGHGVNSDIVHAMFPTLLGSGLGQLNEKMIKFLKFSVDELASRPNAPLDLHAWCRHAITVASTDAVYGLLNPYKAKIIEKAFWDFESNLSLLLLNIVPWFTARKTWRARERLVASLVKYYEAKGHEDSSQLAYGRWKTQHDAGATTEDIARLESAMGIGLLSNTVPSTFWTIFDIYSRPTLVGEIREELRQNAVHVEHDAVHVVDLADVSDKCPLLVSAFQEVLRLRSHTCPMRVIYNDMMLNNQYLLKAGAILQMPAYSINRHSEAWGEKSNEFDGWRFVKTQGQKDSRRVSGFMSFGAAPHICPGRHFATGEILAVAAMIILRFDITPATHRWIPPKVNPRAMAASVSPPWEEFKVTVAVREEYQGVDWAFRVTEGRGKFGLVIG